MSYFDVILSQIFLAHSTTFTSMEPGQIIRGQTRPDLILPFINNHGDNDYDDYDDDDEKDDQVLLDRPILSGIRLDSTQLCASLSLSPERWCRAV